MSSDVRRSAARRAAGTSTRRRTSLRSEAGSWPKVIVSLVTLDATQVPRPARASVRLSACRRPRASQTMGRLTPNRRDSSASDGGRSLTLQRIDT